MSAQPADRATPQQYRGTFELTNDGQAVLNDLVRLFGGPTFAAGQPDVTAFRCGAKAVIEHVYAQLEKTQE